MHFWHIHSHILSLYNWLQLCNENLRYKRIQSETSPISHLFHSQHRYSLVTPLLSCFRDRYHCEWTNKEKYDKAHLKVSFTKASAMNIKAGWCAWAWHPQCTLCWWILAIVVVEARKSMRISKKKRCFVYILISFVSYQLIARISLSVDGTCTKIQLESYKFIFNTSQGGLSIWINISYNTEANSDNHIYSSTKKHYRLLVNSGSKYIRFRSASSELVPRYTRRFL